MTSVVYKHYLCAVTTFSVGCRTVLIVNVLSKTSIFQRICKKNNQSSVSDVNREIPETPRDGKPRFRYHPFTLGLGFLCLHWRPMIDSICTY